MSRKIQEQTHQAAGRCRRATRRKFLKAVTGVAAARRRWVSR